MKLISHRGNLSGRNIEKENTIGYIESAINKGFDCEIDVWAKNQIWLGHDKPEHACPLSFLFKHQEKLWIHCKNLQALEILINFKSLNVFWHQEDDFTLTSKHYIWTYPNKPVSENSVLVVDNALNYSGEKCYGLCSDTIL